VVTEAVVPFNALAARIQPPKTGLAQFRYRGLESMTGLASDLCVD
jgi:hypothetical protein